MNKSILITGVAGSGKSSVCNELVKRGYKAYDIEDMEGFFEMVDKKTGKVVENHNNDSLEEVKQHDWVCSIKKLKELIRKNTKGVIYYCGTASNIDEILPLFDKVILLRTNLEVLHKRLTKRKSKDFAKTTEVQEWVFRWKDWWESHMQEMGAVSIDASRNVEEVTTEVIEKSKKT